MLCFNDSCCPDGNQSVLGLCIDSRYDTLTLPMIWAIVYDLPSLRNIYFLIFICLISIGLINNIFTLMTVSRDRIRRTICGMYLIIYSICGLTLMILISTNIITSIYYDEFIFRAWACHGYPYLSLVMVYTSILISTAIAVEGVLYKCFSFDKFRSCKQAIIISLCFLMIVLITNLDKISARHLIIDPSGSIVCVYKEPTYQFWSTILFYTYMIIPCLIHWICMVCTLFVRTKESCIQKIVSHQNYFIPSLFIILCLCSYGLFRYYLIYLLNNILRLHLVSIFLLYGPQIFTYVIYILPNEFYVREFYQIWFYRKLCCCFYNKKRHVQQFEVIHKLWQRRTSLETNKTISNLDDACVDSEFYKTLKMES